MSVPNEFLGLLALELRKVILPITETARILRIRMRGETDEVTAARLERQVARMERLIADLHDVSLVTRGLLEIRPQRVLLAPLIEQAIDTIDSITDRERVLEVTHLPYPIVVEADSERLRQVIEHLLINACKFTDTGGRIALSVDVTGREVAISVHDNGIGVAPERLPQLFDPFPGAVTSAEPPSDGLGIGLTLVRAIVELHGGTLAARSEGIGRGAEFIVTLPMVNGRYNVH